MNRKIVKHGPSSYIVSLPIDWIKKLGIVKGDEVNVEEVGGNIVISANHADNYQKAEIDVNESKSMTGRIINSLYLRGIDEVRLYYSTKEQFQIILEALSSESNEFQIVETTKSACTIRTITKLSNEFDVVLRRIFLITISLAEEGTNSLEENNFDSLRNISILENSNDRMTTFCRRYMNKYTLENYDRLGPLYFIIELLENIADEYKYLFDEIAAMEEPKLNRKLVNTFVKLKDMLRIFYEFFYKRDNNKIIAFKKDRDELLKFLTEEFKNLSCKEDLCLYHHSINLMDKMYMLLGPYLILAYKE